MKDVWIGLVGVGSLPGGTTLRDAGGAYVNALAPATSAEGSRKAVEDALLDLDLFAFEFEDVENFADRASRHVLETSLVELAKAAQFMQAVQFGDFHTYPSEKST